MTINISQRDDSIQFNETDAEVERLLIALDTQLDDKINITDDVIAVFNIVINKSHKPAAINKHFEQFSKILGKLYIYYPKKSNVHELIPNNTKEQLNIATKLLSESADVYDKYNRKLSFMFENKYSWFKPTWRFGELLSTAYSENDDPGKIIGDYIKLIFPDSVPGDILADNNVNYVKPVNKIEYKSEVYNLIKSIGTWIIDNLTIDANLAKHIQAAFINILDMEDNVIKKYNLDICDMLIAVLNTPNEFFYAWLNEWYLYDYETTEPDIDQFRTILLHYPIGEYGSPLILTNAELNKEYSIHRMYPKQLNGKYMSYGLLNKLFYKLHYDGSLYSHTEEAELLIDAVFKCYTMHRHKLHGNVCIYKPDDISFISECFHEYELDHMILDLTMFLANGERYDNDYNLTAYLDDNSSYAVKSKFFDQKLSYYVAMIKKSNDECLYELGAALLSFYLFARGIVCRCRFGDISRISELIDFAINRPGKRTVIKTLINITSWGNELYKADPIVQLALKIFSNYIPHKAELHLLEANKRTNIDKKIATEWLVSEIGKSRISKLSTKSVDWLIDYKITWDNCYHEFGFGIKDWGSLVLYHTKVIEHELILYYDNIFNSDDYDAWFKTKKVGKQKQTNLTAGWILEDLANCKHFSPQLLDMLAGAKMQLHQDKELTKELKKLFTEYRNKAAHIGCTKMSDYSLFVEKIYGAKLLCKFVDSIQS